MAIMHPEITYRLATLRLEEDARRRRLPRVPRRPRPHRLAAWRHRHHGAPTARPVELVPLPPPRQGREPADRRAA